MIRAALLLLSICLSAAAADEPFRAHWIAPSGTDGLTYGVYHFRHQFHLDQVPASLPVRVSADNRYQLFVNGHRISSGPSRGDLDHWRYETVDIARELKAGDNVLAALVWNDGPDRAIAQLSERTAFLLDANEPFGAVLNTGKGWRVLLDRAYAPQMPTRENRTGYRAVGPNEHFDARQFAWGWEQAAFDDASWPEALVLSRAALRDERNAPNRWMLVPSLIPVQEESAERLAKVREAKGVKATDQFLQGKSAIQIAPHTQAALLLDQSYLTTAYPELSLSGGKNAEVQIRYAEALYEPAAKPGTAPSLKGDRDQVAGKVMAGDSDIYIADGGAHRLYRPLFWRTYRYVQLDIRTEESPLIIEDFRGSFTAYPFQRKASFHLPGAAEDIEAQKILNTGWRTARLCAHETYMDCPYYEQLQYGGDARIQMLISLYMTGDNRLMRNGIALLNSSRTAEGATYSRAPSRLEQYIPPFSLWWIGMVHDYWMYVDDPQFVKEMLPGVRAVLAFFQRYQRDGGSLGHLPWWNFVDWVKSWSDGEPPADIDGTGSAALDLQLLLAYRWAGDLESAFGSAALAAEDRNAAAQLTEFVKIKDYDSDRGLFADQPSHRTFSQHVNSMAVIAHILPEQESRAVLEKTLTDPSLAQSSIYFRSYTNAALREVSLGDRYWDALGPWRVMLGEHLTTWAEWDGPDARSDCHAWGSSPNFELLRTVAGISSDGPGFRRIRIAPNVGRFKTVNASMPHPHGTIAVSLESNGSGLQADVTLPSATSGSFVYHGQEFALKAGTQHLEVKSR